MLYAIATGALAAVLLLTTTLGGWSLAVALSAEGALIAVGARRSSIPGALQLRAAYSMAFSLLAWPVLLLCAGALWGERE